MQLKRVTKNGVIVGKPTDHTDITAFLGIRYATAGRWEYPCLAEGWEGVYDATGYGPTCIQAITYEPEEKTGRVFYYNEFRKNVPFSYSGDCLRLNIWMPDGAVNAPVVVYLHGGAFLGGSTQEKCFDGAALSERGLVVVTVEFRIGILGFGAFRELNERDGHTGNYGLYDALTALEWVQNNIEDFGGDPSNVTLMGQSAGGRMAQCLCLSPLAAGKFQKAVMCSVAGGSDLYTPHKGLEGVEPLWREVMETSGKGNFAAFLNADNEVLARALSACLKADFMRFKDACAPIVDGLLIPKTLDEAVENGGWAKIPYLIGSTSEDLDASRQCVAVQKWAERSASPCYRYHFSRQLPGDDAGAFHSSDLWYWFGTLSNCWRPFAEWDRTLSNAMMTYLAAFAKTGVPEGKGLPRWACEAPVDTMLCFTDTEIKMRTVDADALTSKKG